MLFFVRFDVKQPSNVSNADLVAIWQREAAAAAGAREAGAVTHLWKVAGQRTVLAIVDLPSAEDWTARWRACRSSARWGRASPPGELADLRLRHVRRGSNSGVHGS